ncbi:MAG TPA: PaaI family thioesterase [Acidimicrobiia bacterium]|nr:PaaI family thioesterase [Acidimicrobiia bacterium]
MPRSDEEQARARLAMREIMLATPYIERLGIVVEDWTPDGVRLRVPFAEELTNGGGAYHGGAVASLVDTAGAAAVWAGHDFDRGARAATISMTVNYVGASPYADLVAEARCIKRGRDLSFAEIHVRDPDGKPLATATLVYRIVE